MLEERAPSETVAAAEEVGEEWEDDAENETVFKIQDKEEQEKPEREVSEDARNTRYEFQPHVRPMDQFTIREVVRIGRHMK